MAERVVLFVDYQNAYRHARDAFHDHSPAPYWMGQFDPAALGAFITGRHGQERELRQVRMYRGMPDATKEQRANRAVRRQIAKWQAHPLVEVTTRPLRYPPDYPSSRAQEKGIDVQLALDFAMMAVRNEYDIGILMSNDTDLRPALEEVIQLGTHTVEVAAWHPLTAQRRRLTVRGSPLYCRWIDYRAYSTIQDNTDYVRRI